MPVLAKHEVETSRACRLRGAVRSCMQHAMPLPIGQSDRAARDHHCRCRRSSVRACFQCSTPRGEIIKCLIFPSGSNGGHVAINLHTYRQAHRQSSAPSHRWTGSAMGILDGRSYSSGLGCMVEDVLHRIEFSGEILGLRTAEYRTWHLGEQTDDALRMGCRREDLRMSVSSKSLQIVGDL